MSISPEFVRNLTLQLSLQRFLIAPFAIGAVFLVTWLGADNDPVTLAEIAELLFWVLVLLWGTRRAAEALAEEVSGGTWDSQRMSALGAWSMAWGKFFGGTIYVWYCAGLGLAVWILARLQVEPASDTLREALFMVGSGLFAQIVAFAAGLMFLRKQPLSRRLPVTFCQLLGLGAGLLLRSEPGRVADLWFETGPVAWYGLRIDPDLFHLLSLAAFSAWSLAAAYRLMRAELQFRTWPWVWIGFVVFLMVYAEGFFHAFLAEVRPGAGITLLVPLAVGVGLTYAALFGEQKDVVRYRWALRTLGAGDWRRGLALLPLWVPTCLMVAGLAIINAIRIDPTALAGSLEQEVRDLGILPTPAAFVALLCFLLRDVALVLALNFGRQRRRADLTAVVYLVVLYGPLPGIVMALGLEPLGSLFYPASLGSPVLTLGPPALEAAAMIALLALRWRAANRAIRPAPVEATGAAVA
jgi:hypothetical protein